MTDDFQKQLKNQFPIIEKCSYLNSASSGLTSKYLLDFRKKYDMDIHTDYTKIDYLEDVHIDNVRSKIKKYFYAQKAEVALVSNFSIGINFIAESLPSNSKILLLNGDYPSVNLPFEKRDFKLYYAEINEKLEDNILQRLEECKPDYIFLSVVQFISGIIIDFNFLHRVKLQFPDLQIIGDATQYIGTSKFNFDNSPFSAIGSSGYKWLNAGTGNAFFLLSKSFLNKIEPKSVGSNSLASKPNGLIRKTGFLEPGHFDMHSFRSLGIALDFHFQEIGIEKIENHIKTISSLAKKEFSSRNLLKESSKEKKRQHNSSREGSKS